jgi:hypothetical protein
MVEHGSGAAGSVKSGRRTARRLVEAEAYRRIMVGDVPQTLSEFAAQLSAWLRSAHPEASAMPAHAVEETIRDTWHRRHELIGSGL